MDKNGHIEHQYWKENYDKLRIFLNILSEGYIEHEAVQWYNFKL